ncbi:hypothetical protein [Pseudomonas huaxiensis]|uniref:hypothetical protein n=1 Tax=Pseudomonas huaxiensis TaxID=2213017 RepID=UPI000DA6984F|nr:hypothetical protein [Pseudomonas huaxiensis]
MPFNAPYRQYFSKGDLVYGFAIDRPTFLTQFWLAISGEAKNVWTVDNYRTATYDQKVADADNAYNLQALNYDPVKQKNQLEELGYARAREMKLAESFKQDLSLFRTAMAAHEKYKRYLNQLQPHNFDEEAFSEAVSGRVSNDAFRAKSKFGMEWTIKRNSGLNLDQQVGFHIHFVLNSIDMAAVVTKTHKLVVDGDTLAQDLPRGKSQAAAKERTITHSELRWIYRNRNNPLVQKSVQFWKDGVTCCPPWENDSEFTDLPSGKRVTWKTAWNAYKPSMTHDTFS